MSVITLNNRGVRNVSEFGSVAPGSMVFIKKVTASSDSDVSFVDGTSSVVLDSTYKEYIFKFINLHPSEASRPQFNLSADSGSNYNVTKTTTFFAAFNDEGGTSGAISYSTGGDLAQGTGVQRLGGDTDADNDTAMSGEMWLFNPSSTTYVKHFMARVNQVSTAYSQDLFTAGYGNTTSAVNAVQFSQDSGTIQSGTIKMYGVV